MDVIVRKSKIDRKGVFAKRDFKKGEIVIKWNPKKIILRSEINKLSRNDQNHTTYIGKGEYALMGVPERFVNHSCEPTTFVRDKKNIALRNIKKGKEITTDYALNSIENWEMKCNCGSKTCRKFIYGGFWKLDKKSKNRLKPYLEDWHKKIKKNYSPPISIFLASVFFCFDFGIFTSRMPFL